MWKGMNKKFITNIYVKFSKTEIIWFHLEMTKSSSRLSLQLKIIPCPWIPLNWIRMIGFNRISTTFRNIFLRFDDWIFLKFEMTVRNKWNFLLRFIILFIFIRKTSYISFSPISKLAWKWNNAYSTLLKDDINYNNLINLYKNKYIYFFYCFWRFFKFQNEKNIFWNSGRY